MQDQLKLDSNYLDSFLLINKEAGCSSFDVVKKVKKITGMKAGHCGTLDPFATGLMIVALGKATRFIEYLLNQDKEYIFTIKWGEATDSYDVTGKVVASSDIIPSQADLKRVVASFIGKQIQIPPVFSALKVNGRRAYDYARKGENIELKGREIEVFDFQLLDYNIKEAKFKLHCSKGTYVRSIAHDLCAKLSCCGYVKSLHRSKICNFSIDQAVKLEGLQIAGDAAFTLSIDEALYFLNSFTIGKDLHKKLQHGCKILIKNLPFSERSIIKIKFENRFFAIGQYSDHILKPKKILLT